MKLSSSHFLRLPKELLEDIIHRVAVIERAQHCELLGWSYPVYTVKRLYPIALSCRQLYLLCTLFLWRDREFNYTLQTSDRQCTVNQLATCVWPDMSKGPCHSGLLVRSLSCHFSQELKANLFDIDRLSQFLRNLKALRIDFDGYNVQQGLFKECIRSFAKNCPSLSELYIQNYSDTSDDFRLLLEYQSQLRSLTLVSCAIQRCTMQKLVDLWKPCLRTLLLQCVVLIDKDVPAHTVSLTSRKLFSPLFRTPCLTSLALSDSISCSQLQLITTNSPALRKLAIVVHEQDAVVTTQCLLALAGLEQLTILSLTFRRTTKSKYESRLPCYAPAAAWLHLVTHLTSLRLIHVSAAHILLHSNVISRLLAQPLLEHIMLHHMALVDKRTLPSLQVDNIGQQSEQDLANAQNILNAWMLTDVWSVAHSYFMSFTEAQRKGFRCFDTSDQVCFVKGFGDWTK